MSLFPLTTEAAVARITERNGTLCTYVTTLLPEALREAESQKGRPRRSPLHGVPYSLKDEFETPGVRTTGGSYRHRDRMSVGSSPAHEAFRDAGAILLGKSNLSDMGLPPEASSFVGGVARNPYNLERTPGGSSGGSAAAVADGMAAFEWGADIGGSIRLPAAFCGILGMRLSDETWPITTGFFPMVPSTMQWMCGQGPFTRTIPQMRAVLAAAAPRVRTGSARRFSLKGAFLYSPDRPGLWPTFKDDARAHVIAALDGGEVREDHGLPVTTKMRDLFNAVWASHFEDLVAVDPTLSFGEGLRAVFSSILFRGRFGDRRFYPNAAELLLLIAIGRYTLYRDKPRALAQAMAVRTQFQALWDRGFLVVAPVCVFPAPRLHRSNRNPHLLSCTVAGNLADATGLSIPFGFFANKLPRALQLLGPPGSENLLLDVAERLIASRDADAALRWLPPP